MSAAAVATDGLADLEERKRARLYQLWRWLVSLGVCDSCASSFGLAGVEKEMGDKTWKPWPSRCTKQTYRRGTGMVGCKEIATEAWPARPRQEKAP